MTPRALTGLGILSRLGLGKEAFYEGLRTRSVPEFLPIESFDPASHPEARVYEVPGFDAKRFLGDKGLRTLDRLTKLMVVAARLSLHDAGLKRDGSYVRLTGDRVGICCSNAYGTLEAATELNRVAQLEDVRYINPAKFPNTVANSASGYVSIWEDLRAINVTVSDGNCGALDAIACADIHLASERADAILVGGAEAMTEALYLAFLRVGAIAQGATIGEGAAFMPLETIAFAKERKATVLAEVHGYGTSFMAPDDERLIYASKEAMARAIDSALKDAGIGAREVDVVSSGVSGLRDFDAAELGAIRELLGDVAVAAPKRVLGDSLGASGALGMASALAWLQGVDPATLEASCAKPPETVLITTLGFYGNASALVLRRPS